MSDTASRLLKRYFDKVDIGGDRTLHVPRTSVLALGSPPWELEIDDQWADVVPMECTDLVQAVVWRGVRYERSA